MTHERKMSIGIGVAAILLFVFFHSPAFAHDLWANGSAVPSWVGASCCGPADAHHLDRDQVHTLPDGWHIDGLVKVIPYGVELPSQDGDYWIFYRQYVADTKVYCFFAPPKAF